MSENNFFKPFGVILVIFLLLSSCQKPLEPQLENSQTPTQILSSQTPTPINEPDRVETIHFNIEEEPSIPDAEKSLLFGDYEKALRQFQIASDTAAEDAIKLSAQYGIALTYYKQKEYILAINAFTPILEADPESIQAARSHFILGQIYTQLDRVAEAIEQFKMYLQLRPGILDSYTNEILGDLYIQQEIYDMAIESYKIAALAQDAQDEYLTLKIAKAYQSDNSDEIALSMFKDLYYNTENPQLKAQMDLLIGRIFYENQDLEQAYIWYQDAINNYPETYDAYAALTTLVNDEQEVDEFQRGLINYYIGQNDLAIAALNRYMANPQNDIAAALYYQGLSSRAAGLEAASLFSSERLEANKQDGLSQDVEAITIWRAILRNHKSSPYYEDAWERIAETQFSYMNDPQTAAETLLTFVGSMPGSTRASSAIFAAGRYYEIAGMITEAAGTWERLGDEYPSSNETFQGLFFGGMLYFRLEDFEKAQLVLNRALILSSNTLESSGANLWLGIVKQETGNMEGARDSWRAAINIDPWGYYGLRAKELLNNETPFMQKGTFEIKSGWDDEKRVAYQWLVSSFNLPPEPSENYLNTIKSDRYFMQANEYWKLGMVEQGRVAFENLRQKFQSDIATSFELLQILIEYGYHRSAIDGAQSLIKLAGMDVSNQDLPDYFRYIIFGTYYHEWIIPVAETYSVDPILLFSIILQESHFEGYISSSAGARGLMQIMPATGAQIAGEINFPQDFEESDLDTPYISLVIGTNYLKRQLNAFNNDVYAALAAYNGGPGNALAWRDGSGEDIDLFLGSVRFLETRTYIRTIVENYAQYAAIYSSID